MNKIHATILTATALFSAVIVNFPKKTTEIVHEVRPQVLGSGIDARGDKAEFFKARYIAEPDEALLQQIMAKSYLVFDLKTGNVVVQKNSRQKLPIASLTKLMTGYVAYKNLYFLNAAKVEPKNIWRTEPALGLKSNDEILVQDLFEAMLVGSANDAAFALAQIYENTTGLNFVDAMNESASALNMLDTNFSNPAGFDSKDNFSTAEDLKLLITQIFNIPAFQNLSRKSFLEFSSLNGRNFKIGATNKLISKYQDILAIKTGFTKEALGSMATVLENKDQQIGVIVLDSPQREEDTLLIRKALLSENQ